MAEFTDYDAVLSIAGGASQPLIAYEDESTKPQTEALPLRPPKQQFTSPTEFEQAPAYGDLFGQSDFSHGMGQRRYHSSGRDPRAYWYSDGVDISDPGRLRLLHDATGQAESLPNIGKDVEICNDLPFVINNTGSSRVRRGDGNFPGTWTAEDPGGGASTCYALASQGDVLYAAQGNIYTRSSGGAWSTYTTKGSTDVDRILFAKGRLIASDGRNIYEITASGGTLGSTITAMETVPSGWRFEHIWEQGEYIYALAISTVLGRTEIHHYGPNSNLTALEKKGAVAFTDSQLLYSAIGFDSGTGYLGGGVIEQGSSTKLHPIVYQTVSDARGFLQWIKLAEDNYMAGVHNVDHSVKSFCKYGEAVLMGWNDYDSITDAAVRTGLAVHYPSRDAFANHLSASQTGAQAVTSIKVYRGRILFVRQNQGLHYESMTNYVTTGSITTSFADFNNAGQKIWDTFEVAHSKLRSGESITMLASFDPEALATQTVLTSNTLNALGKTNTDTTNTLKGRVIQMTAYIASGADITQTPQLYSMSARSNPFPATAEFVLVRNYRLFREDQANPLAQPVFGNPDVDKTTIEGMAFQWVTLQEPNKTWTGLLVSVRDITPLIPNVRVSGGDDPAQKAYVLELQLIAR